MQQKLAKTGIAVAVPNNVTERGLRSIPLFVDGRDNMNEA